MAVAAAPGAATSVRDADALAWRAVGTLYNALVTALVVSLVVRRGEETARAYVFRHFRRQHLDRFLGGLDKLGLAGQPHAVACALYHYHSNALGGVATEYVRVSDAKAWVRYPPPRWMWRGTAIAAIPHAVSAAMLHGWHGHNGVTLGNPRLGFVCTGMTVDGLPGLEGYYLEHDRPLAEHERVRFAYGEETMPPFDPAAAPRLEVAAWPQERLARTRRRYAMDYVRTLMAELEGLLGAHEASVEFARAARLTGLQFFEEAAAGLLAAPPVADGRAAHARAFADWLAAMLAAQGEAVRVDADGAGVRVALAHWKLGAGLGLADPCAALMAWQALWAGAGASYDRFLRVECSAAPAADTAAALWRVLPRA